MEIYPAKSKFWEPNIGETFNAFLDFVKSERGINDPYDLNIEIWIPDELRLELSQKYLQLHELITGEKI